MVGGTRHRGQPNVGLLSQEFIKQWLLQKRATPTRRSQHAPILYDGNVLHFIQKRQEWEPEARLALLALFHPEYKFVVVNKSDPYDTKIWGDRVTVAQYNYHQMRNIVLHVADMAGIPWIVSDGDLDVDELEQYVLVAALKGKVLL